MRVHLFSLRIALAGTLLISGIPSAFAQNIQLHNEAAQLNNQGVALLEEGREAESLPLFNRSLVLEEDPLVFFNRGTALYNVGRLDEALLDANRVLQRNNSNAEGLELRSKIHLALKNYSSAFADSTELLQIEPDNLRYAIRRGNSAFGAKNYASALDSYFYAHTLLQKPNLAQEVKPTDRKLIRQRIATIYGILGVPTSSFLDADSDYPLPVELSANFQPKTNEIRLDGICAAVDSKNGTVSFDALTVSMPDGTTKVLPQPKRKVLKASGTKPLNANHDSFSAQPKAGDFLVVVGADNGKLVTPRQISLGAPKIIDLTAEPTVDFAAIGRPKFILADRTYTAGTAFFATYKKQSYMVSAWHLLQDENSQSSDKGAGQTLNSLKEISVAPFVDGQPAISREVITRTGFSMNERANDLTGDLLIAKTDAKTATFPLAKELPDIKQSVWIAAKDTLESKTKTRRAFVTRSSEKELVLTVDPKEKFPLTAMSGAPILNSQGQVVGVVLGGGKVTTSNDVMVYAAPVSAIYERLAPLD